MPKYLTKQPRYIGGEYIHASPEEPAIVELPEGTKPALGMEPYKGGDVVGETLKPAFNDAKPVHPSSAAIMSTPMAEQKSKKGRASDNEVL